MDMIEELLIALATGAGVATLVAFVWFALRYLVRRWAGPILELAPPAEAIRPVPMPPRRPEPRFIDRHDHDGRDLVKRVSEALAANRLVTVRGAGGVGKTTLAIEVAHRLCPEPYSGGVIWHTADAQPDFTLVTLVDKTLTDLGREEARTLAPDAKADLANRLLTEAMPCLLVLDRFDNIADEDQTAIIAFLKELSCPVLVTSRKSLPIGQNIHIGPMTPDEANQFLQSLVEQSTERAKLERVGLEEIAQVAERNPMLMRWLVAQLEQAMRPQDVFDDIARGTGEAVDRIFGRTFHLLGDDGQTALLALALFVPTASREALAAVCGFEDGRDRVNEAIRRLAAFDLLDTAVEGDRLGIVALTRHLTEAQLKEDERTEGLKGRFIAYFLAYAEGHPRVTKEDLDALDDERANLLAALDYAYAIEDWESVMRIANAIAFPGLLDIRGYWDEAITWGERAAEAASQVNLPALAAAFSGDVGTIRLGRGGYAEARQAYQKALLFFQKEGDEPNVAVALHQLGRVAQLQGNYQEAKDLYIQSLEIKRNLGDQAGIVSSLHQLGIIAQLQGDYQEAEDLYNQSLEIKRNLGDQTGMASSLHQLGSLAEEKGEVEEAAQLYRQALAILERLGSPDAEIARRSLTRVTGRKPKE